MEFTSRETASLERTAARLTQLLEFLQTREHPAINSSPQRWFAFMAEIKRILGNFNNDLSLVACLMAKEYLNTRHAMVPFDVAVKPQGASGLDIDERIATGERVIGEIKTTSPYQVVQFGAAQITSLRKDFAKLERTQAAYRYMFVTDIAAFDALKRSFAGELQGVTIVCLTSGDEYACPRLEKASR